MSIKAELRNKIWQYIMQHIEMDDSEVVSKTVATFGISKTTVYNYLKKMVADEYLIPSKEAVCGYALKITAYSFDYHTSEKLEEDRIFNKDMRPLFADYPKNVFDCIQYIFTEMMNNAIEHAEAENIRTVVLITKLNTSIIILDDGVGIFKKIQNYFAQRGEKLTLDEAVDALFPGKLTTAEKNHSGEGIFFSSKAADEFAILSDDKMFRRDSFSNARYDFKDTVKGTAVYFCIANNSAKQLKDVFGMFSDSEKGFFKTQIPITHMFSDGNPVSRSEARRLGGFIDRFEEVTLDFKDVDSIGQAFTHELFIVFQGNHPNIKINIENANEDVTNMILRVKNTK